MDWQELTTLTRGRPFRVERVRLADNGVAVEGEFELPQLAQLNVEDQVFVTAFVRCHGSIKEMERIFGVSYPTVKSRLNRIGRRSTSSRPIRRRRPPTSSTACAAARSPCRRRSPHWRVVARDAATAQRAGQPPGPSPDLDSPAGTARDAPPLPILFLALLAGAFACLMFHVNAARALGTAWHIVCALPGTRFEIEQDRTAVLVAVR